ncbi:14644_t:CDS:2 [Funneliformis mosseae]|uniref:14644_t:CDS:1 n=1 Tax=Funneliformis mosseae TaxID=27381 RepID=A0A9N9BAN3_FUNMO|nr:14644_t:CDS:2 [Funneliformis mosseae]
MKALRGHGFSRERFIPVSEEYKSVLLDFDDDDANAHLLFNAILEKRGALLTTIIVVVAHSKDKNRFTRDAIDDSH